MKVDVLKSIASPLQQSKEGNGEKESSIHFCGLPQLCPDVLAVSTAHCPPTAGILHERPSLPSQGLLAKAG